MEQVACASSSAGTVLDRILCGVFLLPTQQSCTHHWVCNAEIFAVPTSREVDAGKCRKPIITRFACFSIATDRLIYSP
jgi:hypothetical protein